MINETIGDLRSLIVQGIVLAVNDSGQAQTVDVQTHDGVTRTGIEVMQPAGFASTPATAAGGLVLLLAVGGDPANLVALPVASPGARFGGMAAGESVLYAPDGSRVAVRTGGTIEILAAAHLVIRAPDVTITAPNGVTIVGNLTVTGEITAKSGGASSVTLSGHKHPANNQPPTPGT